MSNWTLTTTVNLMILGVNVWTEATAEVSYNPTDPYAISMSFPGDIVWMFGRDLLRAGLSRPAGEGDVRIWPSHKGNDALFIGLNSPTGEVVLEVNRATLSGFLARTDEVVHPGSEESFLAFDEELAELYRNHGETL